ncbi:MAG: M43 family zinc metalloprotease, partial [Bacteroidota bacterium]
MYSQDHACCTPQNFVDPLGGKDPMDIIGHGRYFEDYTIKIYVHLVVEDDGTGGPTETELLEEIEDLVDYYDQHDICFVLMGYDYIRDSDYASDPSFSGTDANNLIADYPPQADVIDIYILPDYTFYRGNAFAIPNHYLLIYAGRFNTCHLAHEVGHCLGLYHTHQGNATADNANCSSTGDVVCDTPADPQLSGSNVNGSCVYTGSSTDPNGDPYNPDVTNTMSYAPYSCRGAFTNGQEARMKATLQTAAVLQPLQVGSGVS